MKLRFLFLIAGCAVSGFSAAAWTVTVLHPSGASSSFGKAGAGSSQVGYSQFGSYRASLWSGTSGSHVNLHPATATSSTAWGCSATNQVGGAVVSSLSRASLWSGTAASWVNLTPAGMAPAYAYSVFGNTQVGYVTSIGEPQACKWNGTAASFLNLHPNGAVSSVAVGVSNSDQVGYAKFGVYNNAARWTGTAASFVNLNPTGAQYSSAAATDGTNQVGTANFDGDQHAAKWSGSAASFVDLHPTGAELSAALGLSGNYQVGYIIDGQNNHAVYWKGTAASMVNLHSFLTADYSYSFAYGVWTDAGGTHIIGTAYNDTAGRDEAVMWTEVTPGSFTFSLNKTQVAGQNSVQGTISSAAEPNNRVYTTYDNSSLVNTPPTVTLLANTTVKNFQITTLAVNSQINTTIYAKRDAITRSAPLALIPLVPTAMAFTPSQVTGGQTTSCRVVINGVAGPGGRTIAILDNSPNATVPSTVTVPAGATQVIFNITTTPVTSQKTVTVTARVSAGEKTGTFKINP